MRVVSLIFCLLATDCVSGQVSLIPLDVRHMIKNVKSVDQLKQLLGVRNIRTPDRNTEIGGVAKSGRQEEEEDFEVIRNATNAVDTCGLISVCVPLPVDERDLIFDKFPQCITLNRCMGGCCSKTSHCRPVVSTIKKVKVEFFNISYHAEYDMASLTVSMDQHTNCTCSTCEIEPHCNKNQIPVDCQCQCANRHKMKHCAASDLHWSEKYCECRRCRDISCELFFHMDPLTCECRSNFDSDVQHGQTGFQAMHDYDNLEDAFADNNPKRFDYD